ncbi:hypothetical protein D3C87_601460 [compost metagenome]
MKKSLFVAAIAAFALVACKKTENVETTSADSLNTDSAVAVVDSATTAGVDSVKVAADSATAKVDSAKVAK